MARLFISQDRLDSWSMEDRIKVDGDTMTLAGDGRSFKIKPACRFLKIAGGDAGAADPNKLLGKVKSMSALIHQGAEVLGESVILGDVAYDVQSGFIGEPIGG
jgi:hypothetical protein